jgi:lipopolysaccharide/colanic/teichoic acid biosynthesis glycosyltransferase
VPLLFVLNDGLMPAPRPMVLQQMRKAAAASRDVLAGVKKCVWEVNVGGFSRLLFDLMLALITLIALPLMMVVAAALIVAAQVFFTRLRRRCRKDCRGQKQVSLHSSHA